MSLEKYMPITGAFDPADWTTGEIARHICVDAHALITKLSDAQTDRETDNLLNDIQDFTGKMRSWLQLYGAVVKQEIVA